MAIDNLSLGSPPVTGTFDLSWNNGIVKGKILYVKITMD